MINIMLDLETWGTDPGCDIRSIGACVFDPRTSHVPYAPPVINEYIRAEVFYTAVNNPGIMNGDNPEYPWYDPTTDIYRRYNLTRDPRTVQWWSEQSEEAQAAFADPVDLADGLQALNNWLCDISGNIYVPSHGLTNIRLWSHGPGFDPPILAAAYRAVGLPVPWHYRSLRDTRTIFDAAGIEDHSAWLEQHPGPLAIPHHALDDSICQARAVCAAVARIATPGMTGYGAINDGD